jgi:hypothetical protein
MATHDRIYKSGISEAQPARTLTNKLINLVRLPRYLFKPKRNDSLDLIREYIAIQSQNDDSKAKMKAIIKWRGKANALVNGA